MALRGRKGERGMEMGYDFLGRFLSSKGLCHVFALSLLVTMTHARAASPAPEPTAALPQADVTSQAVAPAAQRVPAPNDAAPPQDKITHKQRQDILKSKFEKMKADAQELASLVDSLQDELHKSNENILSVRIVEKAEKIEKLAKHIKNAAKGD